MLNSVSAGWVHFKLDRGIDHVLIDEAQDTSPRQWDIIERLTSEFTSGAGARDGIMRTIFAVGDEKQSIFSFQGADPREFASRRRDIERRFKAAGLAFEPVSFKHSFRSGWTILKSVDSVFREPGIYKKHSCGRERLPGARRAWRRGARAGRSLETRRARREGSHRGLGRPLRCGFRNQPGSEAGPAGSRRNQIAYRRSHHDRLRRTDAGGCAMAMC